MQSSLFYRSESGPASIAQRSSDRNPGANSPVGLYGGREQGCQGRRRIAPTATTASRFQGTARRSS